MESLQSLLQGEKRGLRKSEEPLEELPVSRDQGVAIRLWLKLTEHR